jgi:hypothetical protein
VSKYHYELISNLRNSNRVSPKSYPCTLLIVRVRLVIDLSIDSFLSEDINRLSSGTVTLLTRLVNLRGSTVNVKSFLYVK